MNEPAIPKPITDLVDEMFGTIPGVKVTKVGWTDSPNIGRSIMIRAQGWAPSLHVRHRVWKQDIAAAHARATWIAAGEDPAEVDGRLGSGTGTTLPPEIHREAMHLDGQAIADALRPCFEHVAFVQRMLSRAGDACDLVEPMPRPVDADGVDLSPLRIDRCLADLLVLRHGADQAVAMLAATVVKALASDSSHTEDVLETAEGGVTAYMGVPQVWKCVTIAEGRRDAIVDNGDAPAGGAVYDGTWVTVGDELPEIIVEAAAGRRLAELVETGIPGFDGAVIKEAFHDGEGGTSFELPADDVRIADHPELGPALTRRVGMRLAMG
jgi:hypothetical protein